MANCKFCGKPVIAGKVFHSECWEKRAVKETLSQFCDQYCRHPRECHDDESLAKHCDNCVLADALGAEL